MSTLYWINVLGNLNDETFIDILPCLSVGKLDFKGYFINFEWLLWYIVLYINKED
mgnify:CR=1 FL=1